MSGEASPDTTTTTTLDDSPLPPTSAEAPAQPSSVNSEAKIRRIPPPCWSPDEIDALIKAYRDKWFSLRRGNLKANHWQEVADEIAAKCCPVAAPKTSVQCRHKMEKLRKRYRGEVQRAVARHGNLGRYSSPWVHFPLLHEMENGSKINQSSNNPPPPSSSSDDERDEDAYNNSKRSSMKRINDLYNSSLHRANNDGIPTGIPLRIPGRVIPGRPSPYPNPNFTANNRQFGNFGPANNGGVGPGTAFRNGFSAKKVDNGKGEVLRKRKADTNGGGTSIVVAEAIQAFGEGFMRAEKAKMDMFRHVEEMRMEMELKRTVMVLESQQRIVEEFAKAVAKRKKI